MVRKMRVEDVFGRRKKIFECVDFREGSGHVFPSLRFIQLHGIFVTQLYIHVLLFYFTCKVFNRIMLCCTYIYWNHKIQLLRYTHDNRSNSSTPYLKHKNFVSAFIASI